MSIKEAISYQIASFCWIYFEKCVSSSSQKLVVMFRFFLLLIVLVLPSAFSFAQVTILEARNTSLGTEVTVQGIVTSGDELGVVRYLQDETAGIAAYPGNGSVDGFEVVKPGDEISVTGILTDFNDLLEISPITGFSILSTNNELPEPLLISPEELGEAVEGQLVKIECSIFQTSASSFSGNQLYNLSYYAGSNFAIYLNNNHPLVGSSIPDTGLDIVGIASEFNEPQLLVRSEEDLQPGPCFFILDGPRADQISTSGFRLQWTTNESATTVVRYGEDPGQLNELSEPGTSTNHQIELSGLEPATFYWLEVVSAYNGVEAKSILRPFTTASNSSGEIQVYFNQSTDPDYSDGTFPAGSTFEAVEAAIKARIDAAEATIDVMMYNTSREWLVTSLEEAVARGVQVRYIADDQTSNDALTGSLDFPVLEGNDGNPLMHNKVFIIDAASVDESYVITGSMNMTYNNVITDPNNTLIIQDQALAKAYTWEFVEMWGGDSPLPNEDEALFGVQKKDNTPIYFNIGGIPVELYCSPNGGSSDAILDALDSADDEILLALLLITQNRIGDLLVDKYDAGVGVRGIVENISDPGSEFFYLQSQGLNVHPHAELTQFHHKYAIVDGDLPTSDPLVITGSYNWTNAAEFENDESMLVIHDADIANQFVQEFGARWGESTAVEDITGQGRLLRVSPNPTPGLLQIDWSENRFSGELQIYDAQGRMVWTASLRDQAQYEINLEHLAPGYYLLSGWEEEGILWRAQVVLTP